jgi:hypothetical protein
VKSAPKKILIHQADENGENVQLAIKRESLLPPHPMNYLIKEL